MLCMLFTLLKFLLHLETYITLADRFSDYFTPFFSFCGFFHVSVSTQSKLEKVLSSDDF